ncbi:MAG: DUF799 family lipoprotein [Idiomarina sp.]|nr:DUF799 family lipoprotein [Idiomarina sp.]
MRFPYIIIAIVFLAGCATTPPAPPPPLGDPPVRSILVVPVNNESLDVEAPDLALSLLPARLGRYGYYVFPVHTVRTVLTMEGYHEGGAIHAIPTERLTALFDADAVLYVTIKQWTTRYLVIAAESEVKMHYELRDRFGQTLWETESRIVHVPNSQAHYDSPLAALLGAVIDSALERAAPPFKDLATQAHMQALSTTNPLPLGPYRRPAPERKEIVDEPELLTELE